MINNEITKKRVFVETYGWPIGSWQSAARKSLRLNR
mgnify:CR=1